MSTVHLSARPSGLMRQFWMRKFACWNTTGDMFSFRIFPLLPVPHNSTNPIQMKWSMSFIQGNRRIKINIIFNKTAAVYMTAFKLGMICPGYDFARHRPHDILNRNLCECCNICRLVSNSNCVRVTLSQGSMHDVYICTFIFPHSFTVFHVRTAPLVIMLQVIRLTLLSQYLRIAHFIIW